MKRTLAVSTLFLVLAAGCADRSQTALKRVQSTPSALPGMSVEKAVLEVVQDLRTMQQFGDGEGVWYSNRAYEYDDREIYRVGYSYRHGGRSSIFGWVYDYRSRKLTPITPLAEQVHP